MTFVWTDRVTENALVKKMTVLVLPFSLLKHSLNMLGQMILSVTLPRTATTLKVVFSVSELSIGKLKAMRRWKCRYFIYIYKL